MLLLLDLTFFLRMNGIFELGTQEMWQSFSCYFTIIVAFILNGNLSRILPDDCKREQSTKSAR